MISFPTFCKNPVEEKIIKCCLGYLQLKACSAGIHSLDFFTPADSNTFPECIDLSQSDTGVPAQPVGPVASAVNWLRAYFCTPRGLIEVQMPTFCFVSTTQGNRFADRVLQELLQVKFGETVSYAELARRAGNPKASRAVGQAMRSNPACLIIPCHRVILKSGETGHYGGGTKDALKVWLLKYEADNM